MGNESRCLRTMIGRRQGKGLMRVGLTETFSQNEVQSGLRQVEDLLHDTLLASSGCLREIMDYLLANPGKQIRPLLVVLSAHLLPHNANNKHKINNSLITAGAAVEMIHTASLIHDDLIDQADIRRGKPTIHLGWGKREAVMSGDYLIARAFRLLCRTECRENLIPVLARSVALMCRGEAGQLEQIYNWRITEQEYLYFNYLKTSQFIAACCEIGGRVSGSAGKADIKVLRQFGCKMGQAFQVIDDILDFSDCRQQVGKPVGSDIKQGLATLPLIYLLRKNRRFFTLCSRLNGLPLPPALWEEMQPEVRRSGALEDTFRQAHKFKQQALHALTRFPPSPARSLLNELAEKVVDRASYIFS